MVHPTDACDAKQAVQTCTQCTYFYPHCNQVPMQEGQLPCPTEPLQVCHIDYIGPLPSNQGCEYVFTAMDMATGLGFAHPIAQQATKQALEHLHASYGLLLMVNSDRGSHFTGQEIQELA